MGPCWGLASPDPRSCGLAPSCSAVSLWRKSAGCTCILRCQSPGERQVLVSVPPLGFCGSFLQPWELVGWNPALLRPDSAAEALLSYQRDLVCTGGVSR